MRFLVVASCFAPKNVIGAVRLSKIVKYLVRAGNEVTVYSPALESYDRRDETLECKELTSVKRVLVPYSRVTTSLTSRHKGPGGQAIANAVGNQVSTSLPTIMYRKLRGVFSSWRDWEWEQKAWRAIRGEHATWDVVMSSYPNASTHNVACRVKGAGLADVWVADFRDPMVLETSAGPARRHSERLQTDIVHAADIATSVLHDSSKHFICAEDDRQKIVWLPNGFDEDDSECFKSAMSNGTGRVLTLSYAGGMYKGERDLRPVFKAMRELVDERRAGIADIAIDYAGPDGAIVKAQAQEFNLAETVRDHGSMIREEAIKLQAMSDCVLVATFCYQDGVGSIPGKLFEPVMMRKPVLLVVSGGGNNSEAANLVRYLGIGDVYERAASGDDVSSVKDFLVHMLREKHDKGAVSCKMDEERRAEYTHERITKKLLESIEAYRR